jgi:hypothetical protein
MMKNLGLGLVFMVLGLGGVYGCTQGSDDSGSRVQVTCPNGNTCEGTAETCVNTCADSTATSTSSTTQALTSTPDPFDVTVGCPCGGSCTGSPTDCASFCNQICGGGGSGGEILED